jgi:multidrug efflux system outer membrane protein
VHDARDILSLCLAEKVQAKQECDLDAVRVVRWWESFGDETLNTILRRVAVKNQSVRRMAALLEVARAQRRRSISDFFPGVLPKYSHQESKLSAANAPGLPSSALKNAYESANLPFAWEVDILGRLRRQYEASDARSSGAKADADAVLTLAMAEAAANYAEFRNYQRHEEILRKTLALQEESLRKVEALVAMGEKGAVEQAQARADLEAVRARIPLAHYAAGASKERLRVLAAGLPRHIRRGLSNAPRHPLTYSGPVILEDPQSLLRRRPDVVSAERELAATTAEIGVAVADLFPRVDFTGNFGYATRSFSDIGQAVTQTYSLAPQITWALLDTGRVRSEIVRRRGLRKAQLAAYEQVVLQSLEEARNSLSQFASQRERLNAIREVVDNRKEVLRVYEAQYDAGAVDLLSVLVVRRDLLAAELDLEDARTDLAKAVIAIYRAFGGALV